MKLEEWHLREGDDFEERHLASVYLPLLEAHLSESQPDRIERLRRVYNTAQNVFLMIEGRRLPQNIIVALHDNKGQLAVTFQDQDWHDFLIPIFRLAWRSEGEAVENVFGAIRQ